MELGVLHHAGVVVVVFSRDSEHVESVEGADDGWPSTVFFFKDALYSNSLLQSLLMVPCPNCVLYSLLKASVRVPMHFTISP